MDIEGGVGVGDCVGVIVNVGKGGGVMVNFGAGAGLTGVAERTTTAGEGRLAVLAATWGTTSDNLLSPVPAILHPPRKITRADTNK